MKLELIERRLSSKLLISWKSPKCGVGAIVRSIISVVYPGWCVAVFLRFRKFFAFKKPSVVFTRWWACVFFSFGVVGVFFSGVLAKRSESPSLSKDISTKLPILDFFGISG